MKVKTPREALKDTSSGVLEYNRFRSLLRPNHFSALTNGGELRVLHRYVQFCENITAFRTPGRSLRYSAERELLRQGMPLPGKSLFRFLRNTYAGVPDEDIACRLLDLIRERQEVLLVCPSGTTPGEQKEVAAIPPELRLDWKMGRWYVVLREQEEYRLRRPDRISSVKSKVKTMIEQRSKLTAKVNAAKKDQDNGKGSEEKYRMRKAELFLPDELRDKLHRESPVPEDGAAFRDFLPAGEQNLPSLTREQFGILPDAIEGQTAIACQYIRADKMPSDVVCFPYRVEYDGYDHRWWMVLYLPAEDRMIKARLSRVQSLEARKDLQQELLAPFEQALANFEES